MFVCRDNISQSGDDISTNKRCHLNKILIINILSFELFDTNVKIVNLSIN